MYKGIEFASDERMATHRDLLEEFLRKVLGLDPSGCWLSDESSLWDFGPGTDYWPVVEREFGITRAMVPGGSDYIADILDTIAAHRREAH